MRLSVLRIVSYIFLTALILGAYGFQKLPLDFLYSRASTSSESVPVTNTLISLNTLYEDFLAGELDDLEAERRALMSQLESNESEFHDEDLLRQIQSLQDEQRALRGEIVSVQREAEQIRIETEEPLVKTEVQTVYIENEDNKIEMENLSNELEGVKLKLTERIESLNSLNEELSDLRSVSVEKEGSLLSQIDDLEQVGEQKESALTEALGEAERLSAELYSVKSRLGSEIDSVQALNDDLNYLQEEIRSKTELLETVQSGAAVREQELSGSIDILTRSESSLDRQVAGLEDREENLESQRVELNNQVSTLVRQGSSLRDQVSDLEGRLAAALEDKEAAEEKSRIPVDLVKRTEFEAVQETLNNEISSMQDSLHEADILEDELDNIVSNLFAVTGVRGVFVADPSGAGLGLVVNPDFAEALLSSASVSVFQDSSVEVSKILISIDDEGNYKYRVFPGYDSPAGGNWF